MTPACSSPGCPSAVEFLVAPRIDGRPSLVRRFMCGPCAVAVDATSAPGAVWIVRVAAAAPTAARRVA